MKEAVEPGVKDFGDGTYPYAACIRAKAFTAGSEPGKAEYWAGRRQWRRWIATEGIGQKRAMTPSMKYKNENGDPMWVFRFDDLAVATRFYFTFSEGI